MDFFLWGYVKDQVYKVSPTTKKDMKQRIREAFRSSTLNDTNRYFEERIQACLENNGGHIEHLQ